MSDILQANYEELSQLSKRFKSQADAMQQMQSQVKKRAQVLTGGTWQGLGVEAFAAEMQDEVLPSLQRLITALNQSSQVTMKIAQTIRQAEQEAAGLFRGQGGAGLPGGGGAPGDGTTIGPAGPEPLSPNGGQDNWFNGKVTWGGSGSAWGREAFENGKFSPGAELKFGVEGSVYDNGWLQVGKGGAGVKFGVGEDGFSAGAYGEATVVQVGKEGTVLGDKDLGLTLGGEAKALSADGFIGIKDNSLGASVGATLVSAKGEVGTNIAGVNVGVNGEIGLKAEFGFKIGKETEIKLPFISFGFSFGKAKD